MNNYSHKTYKGHKRACGAKVIHFSTFFIDFSTINLKMGIDKLLVFDIIKA